MKKITSRILTGILSLSMFFCATPVIYASDTSESISVNSANEKTTLNANVGIDKKLEIPLTLKTEKKQFYFCTNINPGDTMKSSVVFKNTSSEPVQISIADILNQLTDDKKAIALLDILDLSISIDGSPIYKGIHSKVTTPVTGWINVAAGKSVTMDIEIYLPKDADNTYQNANMKVKWIFEARADVPDDPEEQKKVQTGDESSNNYGMYLLGGALIVCVVGIGIVAIKKKKNK